MTIYSAYQGNIENSIKTNEPTSNLNMSTTCWLGYYSSVMNRLLIKPDFSPIPSEVTINSAILRMHCYYSYRPAAMDIYAYPLLRNWSLTQSTWRIWATGQNWEIYGATGALDIGAAVGLMSCPEYTEPCYYDLDLDPSAVQDIVDGGAYYGFLLRSIDGEANDRNRYFETGNHATQALRPELIVDYSTSSQIKKINGVEYASIKKASGIVVASVKKISGVG